MSVRGRQTYGEISYDHTVGPFNLAFSWGRQGGEQRRTGDAGGDNFSDAKLTTTAIATQMWLWGPKGFMSGSRNGGWRFSYTHNRMFYDAGSGGSNITNSAQTSNEFESMRRWHVIENLMMLRWYQRRNVLWHLQYAVNIVNKMRGGGRADETRRRLGVLEGGGTYQSITFGTKWMF